MQLTIEQEGKGPVEIFHVIPDNLQRFLLDTARPVSIRGVQFNGLFQEFRVEGISAWYNRYWMDAPVILKASGGILQLKPLIDPPGKNYYCILKSIKINAVWFYLQNGTASAEMPEMPTR